MSRFYGFPVFDLPGPQKLALLLARPVLEAEERLVGCRDDEVYDLTMTATGGDEEAAAAAMTDRAAWRLSRNQTPDM